MSNIGPNLEWILKFMDGNWGTTILGWILGWVGAAFSNRRHDRRQKETIEVLSNAIQAFGDRFKDHLEPLEPQQIDTQKQATALFLEHDRPVNNDWMLIKGFGKAFLFSAALGVTSFLLAAYVNPVFMIGVALGMLGVVGAFMTGNDHISAEAFKIEKMRLTEIGNKLRAMKLPHTVVQHVRRWALTHEFAFFTRGNVLRTIEAAVH